MAGHKNSAVSFVFTNEVDKRVQLTMNSAVHSQASASVVPSAGVEAASGAEGQQPWRGTRVPQCHSRALKNEVDKRVQLTVNSAVHSQASASVVPLEQDTR